MSMFTVLHMYNKLAVVSQQQHLVYELGVEVSDPIQGGVTKGATQPRVSAQTGVTIRVEKSQIHTKNWFHEGQH